VSLWLLVLDGREMMTPKQLREKALSKIDSATVLLDGERYDDASYNVGYAAELTLKARYCTTNSWLDFPNDRKEAKRRGAPDIITHELDELLRMAGHDSLRVDNTTMLHIDWDRVLDWSVEQRYQPVGSVTPEHAKAQVEETGKLCTELALFEIVEKLWAIEVEVSNSSGPFTLFALAETVTLPGWEVVISGWWLEGDTKAKTEVIGRKMLASLDDDLLKIVRGVTPFHPCDDLVQAFHYMSFGGIEHHPRFVTSGNVLHCNPANCRAMPAAFIITNAPRSPP
jgi:hypothetical protein